MKPAHFFTLLFSLGSFLLSISACSPKFDPIGMDNINSVGVNLTDLMNKATGTYSSNSTAIATVFADIEQAYEHAKNIRGNKEIAESWRVLNVDLVAPFFEKWKSAGKLDKDFIKESVTQVTKSVTAITAIENAKHK